MMPLFFLRFSHGYQTDKYFFWIIVVILKKVVKWNTGEVFMNDFAGAPIFGFKNNSPQIIAKMLRDLADTVERAGMTKSVLIAGLNKDISLSIVFYLYNPVTGELKTKETLLPSASSGLAMDVISEAIVKSTLESIVKKENAEVAWEITNFLCDFSKL